MAVTKEDVVKLYVALFNRAPEGEGVNYWLNQATQHNWDVATLAENMMYAVWNAAKTDSTFAENYPQYAALDLGNPTEGAVRDVIETVYKILFNKDYSVDPKGIDYWVNNVINEGRSLGKTIADIINSAEQIANNPDAEPDAKKAAQAFENKVKVAEYFAEKVSKFDKSVGFDAYQKVIKSVTDDESTVSAAKEEVDKSYTPKDVTLTTGKDDISGSIFSDTFKADLLTLNDGDKIEDPSTDDNDVLKAEINTNITDGVTIKNVENIDVTSYGTHSIDFTNITGVKTFATVDSTGKITLNNVADAGVGFKFSGQNTNDLEVNYKAGTLTGVNDKLNVVFDNAKDVKLDVDAGFESFVITNRGDSKTDTLTVPGVNTLIVKGDGSIDFGDDLNGFKAINAGDFTGVIYTGKDNDNDGFAENAIQGNSEGTTVILGSGADQIGFTDAASAGKANTIKLGDGNDSLALTTNSGYNYIFGEGGDDKVQIDDIDTNDLVNLGAGTDTLILDLNAGNSTAVLKGVENLKVKGDADADHNVTINSSDTPLNVTLIAEEDNSNLTITNLPSGSTVIVDPKENTQNDVDLLKVTYKNVEDSTTIKVNTKVESDAVDEGITVENVKNLTLTFAKKVDLAGGFDKLILGGKVESLTINASDDLDLGDGIDIKSGDTEGLKTITVTGQKKVDLGDITNEEALTSITATAKGDLTIGNIQIADKLKEVLLTGKNVTVGEIGNNGTNACDELTSLTITATDGDVTLKPAVNDHAAIAAEKLGTVEIKADKGSILVDDGTNNDNGNVLLSASDADGITVKLSAKTAIGANNGSNFITIKNDKGDIDLQISGEASAKLKVEAGDATLDNDTKGVVNLTATNTGGLSANILLDAGIDDNSTSTINLGNAATGKTNVVDIAGKVQTLTINGGSGDDTIAFVDATDWNNANGVTTPVTFKTATISLGIGDNKLDLSGITTLNTDRTDTDTDNGVVANFSSSTITIKGTDSNSTLDDKTVAAGEIKLYDSDGDEDASNTHQKVVEKSWVINTSGVTEFVGTDKADYIVANSTGMTIDGKDGDDIIIGGAGADTITGGAGADTIDLGNDTAQDKVVIAAPDDTATISVVDNDSSNTLSNNDVISPSSGSFDVISNFVHGTDKLDLHAVNNGSSNDTWDSTNGLDANAYQIVVGTWDVDNNQFTVDSGNGTDTMVLFDDGSNDVAVILLGVTDIDSSDLIFS